VLLNGIPLVLDFSEWSHAEAVRLVDRFQKVSLRHYGFRGYSVYQIGTDTSTVEQCI